MHTEMSVRTLSHIDRLLDCAENALMTLAAKPRATRGTPSPANCSGTDSPLTAEQKNLSASLMRINHTGEVCAQALYQGQALTAKLPEVRREMESAAAEEVDHLAWCDQRLRELDSHTSYLNPAFYALSFGLGAVAGMISDRVSLGFVAATEDQVCAHLSDHQQRLPEADHQSRAIVEQMLTDEEKHGHAAIMAGGMTFPKPIKSVMTLMSKVMTETTSRI